MRATQSLERNAEPQTLAKQSLGHRPLALAGLFRRSHLKEQKIVPMSPHLRLEADAPHFFGGFGIYVCVCGFFPLQDERCCGGAWSRAEPRGADHQEPWGCCQSHQLPPQSSSRSREETWLCHMGCFPLPLATAAAPTLATARPHRFLTCGINLLEMRRGPRISIHPPPFHKENPEHTWTPILNAALAEHSWSPYVCRAALTHTFERNGN